MKKVISFSLWGKNPKYTLGAIQNALLAPSTYPGWVCRFYIRDDVPKSIVEQLVSFSHCEVILINQDLSYQEGHTSTLGTLWRFLPASDPNVEVMISRDCDSRLSIRENNMVKDFVSSPSKFHNIKDHPNHYSWKILAGMWGVKQGTIPNMEEEITHYINQPGVSFTRWLDQKFLQQIYSKYNLESVILNHFTSDPEFNLKYPRQGYEFIGEVYDENNKPNLSDRAVIKNFIDGL